jgi:mannose-6-phosphate isomerase-like protein (cupin superfamily)
MATSGQVLKNPRTGDQTTFYLTAADTAGALLRFEEQRSAEYSGPPAHIHLHQSEMFTVLEGTARIQMNGENHFLRQDETLTVPAGTPHTWSNGGQSQVRVMIEFRPALRMEQFTESLALLGSRGSDSTQLTRPSILQMALLALEYDAFLAGPPIFLQRVIFLALKPLALARGYRASYT